MLWRPALAEAGEALAEQLNLFDASCSVDVNLVLPTSGAASEGPVYAFAVTWVCPGASTTTQATGGQEAIVVRDFTFVPAQLTIPANTDAAITLTNEGPSPHNFSIDTLGISVDLAPGEMSPVSLIAAAGTYEFYCNVPGHRGLGMQGTLTAD